MRSFVLICTTSLFADCAWGQAKPFKAYKTQADYCADNPNAPTCIKTWGDKPLILTNEIPGSRYSPKPATKVQPKPTMSAIPVALPGGKPDWRFAHPSGALLMSLNVRAMLESPMISGLIGQVSSQLGSQIPAGASLQFAKAQSSLKGIDRLYLSLVPTTGEPQALALVTGRFDAQTLGMLPLDAASKAQAVNAGALLFGDRPALVEASRRLAGNQPPDPRLVSAEAWAARYDLWITGSPALLQSLSKGAKGPAAMPDMAKMVRSFSAGFSLASGRLDIVMDATTPEAAQQMAGLMRAGMAQRAGGADAAKMTIDVQGTTVNMSATMDQARFPSAMGSGNARGVRTVNSPTLTVDSSPNPNAKPNTVVISGLDDGPKGVKLDPQTK